MKQKGRPKIIREVEKLDFTTFQQDITLFKNYLIDVVNEDYDEDEINDNVPLIKQFLMLDTWKQNIFIIYLLNKEKRVKNNQFSFKALADLLHVERVELMRAIRNIKSELQTIDKK